MSVESPFLTAREAASYVRLSMDHFHRLQAKGLTPGLCRGRKGRKVLYTRAALDRWVERRGSR